MVTEAEYIPALPAPRARTGTKEKVVVVERRITAKEIRLLLSLRQPSYIRSTVKTIAKWGYLDEEVNESKYPIVIVRERVNAFFAAHNIPYRLYRLLANEELYGMFTVKGKVSSDSS